MVELAFRLLAAGGVVLLAGVRGLDQFDSIWKVSAFICAYAGIAYFAEWRGKWNAGMAGLAACFDAVAISLYLAQFGHIPSFGFLVLAPLAHAAAKYGSLPSAMAPIAAFALLGADQCQRQGQPSSPEAMAQALGILTVGLLLNHRRIVVSVAKPVLPEKIEPLQTEEPEAYMELRESFRTLKDMYHDLERKSRKDRHSADLRLVSSGDPVRFHRRLAAQLQKLSGAEGISLYTLTDHGSGMVVRAVEGNISEGIRQTTLRVQPGEALASIKNNTEKTLAALGGPEDGQFIRNVVLTHKGRLAGLVALQGQDRTKLELWAETIEELAPLAAEMIDENISKKYAEARLKRAELLYEVAAASAGAGSANTLAARVVRQLEELWDVESIAVCWVEGNSVLPAASAGLPARPLEAMSFAAGEGVRGWLGVGAPEIFALDVGDDVRCRRAEMGKQRIQSFALAPIGAVDGVLGYLVAASPRSGAVSVPIVEGLRMVAAELYQAVLRLEQGPQPNSGLMLPGEFHRKVAQQVQGCLVYLEPLRRDETLAKYGAPALDIALRQLALRLRARLPEGGAICRRAEGDYIALLSNTDEHVARAWANEAAATASMIGLPVDDNGKRVILAVRAKVARLNSEQLEPEPLEAA